MMLFREKDHIMKYPLNDVKRLIEEVEKRAGEKINAATSEKIHKKMHNALGKLPPFGTEYLNKRIMFEINKASAKRKDAVGLNKGYINFVAEYLSYANYEEFEEKKDRASNEELEKFIGTWISYVRCNSRQPYILMSPVSIYNERNLVYMKLQGKERAFIGELKIEKGKLFCLLKGEEGKYIHLVFNAGIATRPQVLQGIFSGISAGGDAIAGREVLVRTDREFESIRNDKLRIREILNSNNNELEVIGNYFSDTRINIIKAGRSSTFDLGDLQGFDTA